FQSSGAVSGRPVERSATSLPLRIPSLRFVTSSLLRRGDGNEAIAGVASRSANGGRYVTRITGKPGLFGESTAGVGRKLPFGRLLRTRLRRPCGGLDSEAEWATCHSGRGS